MDCKFKLYKLSPNKFYETLKEAKSSVLAKYSWRVVLRSKDYYKEFNLYRTELGSCFAIGKNGEIISLCHNTNDFVTGKMLLEEAIKKGGDRVQAFGKQLYYFYTRNGFEAVTWIRFDENLAPTGWNKNRDEEEPLIFYKYVGYRTKENFDKFLNRVSKSENYDTAVIFRDSKMQKS